MNDSLISLSYALASTKMIIYSDKVAIFDLPFPELLEELKNYDPMKNRNEIKKTLYREKPMAEVQTVNTDQLNNYILYNTTLSDGTYVVFQVPLNEYSDTFTNPMEAHLLIRWMVD